MKVSVLFSKPGNFHGNGCYCGSKMPFFGKVFNVCLLVSSSYLLAGKDLASSCSIVV